MGGLLILFLAGLYLWGAYKVDQRSFTENDANANTENLYDGGSGNDTYIITPGENNNFWRGAA